MREPKLLDYVLLTILALIWSSAFFNIKIATYSYGPVTIALLRTFFRAIPVVGLCLVAGDKRCSLNKVKKILNMKDVSMADADQVKSQTGFSIGGVSPIANLNKNKMLIDTSLSRYEYVYAAAGHPNTIFKISYKQLIKLTEGIEEDIIL